ncbi:hypothetical protein MTR_8g445190 [Medicago truncatula]|uniref:Uncharacterized protein n=1 Tax=Medicago truncatula TaxID=3880 RepID=A0A072TP92_MEDTR|nr:hypothetical protein MTR_8g445190 [Medicago truncatula]
MSLDLSNNPKTREVYSLMFIVDIEKQKKKKKKKNINEITRNQNRQLDHEAKSAKESLGGDLGKHIFVFNLSYFQPESAPNPLSFAPRLNPSNIRS